MAETPLPNINRLSHLAGELLLWLVSLLLFVLALDGLGVADYSRHTFTLEMNRFLGVGLFSAWFVLAWTCGKIGWERTSGKSMHEMDTHHSYSEVFLEEKLRGLLNLSVDLLGHFRDHCKIFLLLYASLLLVKVLLHGSGAIQSPFLLEVGFRIDFAEIYDTSWIELI